MSNILVLNEQNMIQQVEQLWRVFFTNYNENYILQSVHSFFQSVDKMEPFFYFMMSKRILVDHMLPIIEQHITTLHPVKIIPHIIDGWVDFFLKMNYTLGPERVTRDELELYRNKTYRVLSFLIENSGETLTELPYYYQLRLRNYFLIHSEHFQYFHDCESDDDEGEGYDNGDDEGEGYDNGDDEGEDNGNEGEGH